MCEELVKVVKAHISVRKSYLDFVFHLLYAFVFCKPYMAQDSSGIES